MARTLEQIISELNPTFQPQVQSLQERANLIPQQIASEEAGLQAKQDNAFGDIVSGARRRGLGFSGVPLGEQAKYTASEYLPALARLRQSGQERAYSLQDAILGINERRDTLGQQIYQTEQDRAAQEAASARAAAASAQPTLGSFLAGLGGGAQGAPKIAKTNNGFNFFDATGQPITAAQYAQQTGVPIRNILTNLANDNDSNAKIALQYIGNDGSFKSIPAQYRGAFGALGINAPISTSNPVAAKTAGNMSVMLPSILNGSY